MTLIKKEPMQLEEEHVEFYGKSTHLYYFGAYSLDMEFTTNSKGVYIFTKQIPKTENSKYYKRLYVGETDNLATVIQEHINSPCLQKHGVDSICVRIDKDEIDNNEENRRRIVDDILAHRTRPPCNKLWQDRSVVEALKNILKAYPYLEYDEAETKRPLTDERADMLKIDERADMLKIKITDLDQESADVGYEIASELRGATDRKLEYIPSNSRFKKEHIRIVEFPDHDSEKVIDNG